MFLSPKQLIESLNIQKGSTVLEAGSGSGAFVYEIMRKVGDSGKTLAIDNNQDLLNLIKDSAVFEGKSIDILLADLNNNLVLPDMFADYIIIANTFNFLVNKDLFISEMYRLLSPMGDLLFVDWDINNSLNINKDNHSKEEIIAMFYKHGFRLKRELPAGKYHFAFVWGK